MIHQERPRCIQQNYRINREFRLFFGTESDGCSGQAVVPFDRAAKGTDYGQRPRQRIDPPETNPEKTAKILTVFKFVLIRRKGSPHSGNDLL